jgi:5-methylcytosine-specific restriction endonuclease McrA
MTEQQADTCDMCHKKEKENPDMEIWNCYTLCTKCADRVSEYITCQNPPDES